MLKSLFGKNNEVKFLCPEEWWDIVPKPYSAKKFLPDWYKTLPLKINNLNKLRNDTIKNNLSFLDVMNVGYIIPLAADVWFKSNEDCSELEWDSKFFDPLITAFSKEHISNDKYVNPRQHMPLMKWITQWIIQTPPGWSTLFVPPINRPDERFEIVGELVHTDIYFNNIQLPFFFTKPNFDGIIKTATPLAQAIPIKRSDYLKHAKIEKFKKSDYKKLEKTKLSMSSNENYYHDICEKI